MKLVKYILAGLLLVSTPVIAEAKTNVIIGVNPGWGYHPYHYYPHYYQPAPIFVPAPVFVQPQPVIIQQPQVIQQAPMQSQCEQITDQVVQNGQIYNVRKTICPDGNGNMVVVH